MIDLQLDGSNDVVMTDDLHLVSDVEEVKQAVGITLRTRLGEFFADDEMGLDEEYVLGKDYNEQYAASSITDAIQQDPRVTSVSDVKLTVGPQRTLSAVVSFTVDSTIPVEMEVDLDA